MLASKQRLRHRTDFSTAVRAGRRAGRGGLVVHLLPPGSIADSPARAGFVVPRSVGTAVTRNRVRRQLRHLARDRLDRLPAGTHLVIRVLPAAAEHSYRRLGIDLDAAIAAAARSRSRKRHRSRTHRPGEDAARVADAGGEQDVPSAADQRVVSVRSTTAAPARMLMAPIVAYRRWISPVLPDRCRFYPSCSEYALTAIATHGPVRGLGLAVWRLLRCHPFHPGGIDPVPPPRHSAARQTAINRLEQ